MKYFLDTEFNGFGGELISLALVREDGESLYLVYPEPKPWYFAWPRENVVPLLWSIPTGAGGIAGVYEPSEETVDQADGARLIATFLKGDESPEIVADWPEDVAHFCRALLVGPGKRVKTAALRFTIENIEAYPTTLEGAVRHNAWWDAMALRQKVMGL